MTWEMDQKIMQKRYYQQGEKSGEMKGKKIGEKIGARTKALEIAKTLLKDGMPVEMCTHCGGSVIVDNRNQ